MSYRDTHATQEAADNYLKNVYGPRTFDTWLWRHEKRALREIIEGCCSSRKNYLDFACGTGRIIETVAPLFENSTGVDVSAEMLKHARSKMSVPQLLELDLTTDDQSAPGPFDLITAFRFLVNAESDLRRAALKALRQRIATDGLLVVNNHSNPVSTKVVTSTIGRISGRGSGGTSLSMRVATDELERAGFVVVDVVGVGVLTSSLYRLLGERAAERAESLAVRSSLVQRYCTTQILVCRPA